MSLFSMWVCLAGAAFAYQAMTHHDWVTAFGTSWDQAIALSLVWLVGRTRKFYVSPQDRRLGGVE